ncbi:hypothetical protein [Saccharococcus sp. Marseille-Q5394]|nr:hypothetical protein [Saccharococcus sp. Marseille-Q5394]
MPIYNKLFRDLIPQIIEKDGKTCVTYLHTPNHQDNVRRQFLRQLKFQ